MCFPIKTPVEEVDRMEPPGVSREERGQSTAPGGWVVGKLSSGSRTGSGDLKKSPWGAFTGCGRPWPGTEAEGGSWMSGVERGGEVGSGIPPPHSEAMVASPMLANHSATLAGH